MSRLSFGLLLLALVGSGSVESTSAALAWPHRAILTSLHGGPVAVLAYTRGGELVIAVDSAGRYTTTPSAVPLLRALSAMDTLRASTPATFPLDLSKGPVSFVAEGGDHLRLVVGRNPFGQADRISADGRRFTVRLVADRIVIDTR